MVNNMKNLSLFSIVILFSFMSIFAEEESSKKERVPKKFYIPASEFISSGFQLSFFGSPNASHFHTAGSKHFVEGLLANSIYSSQPDQIFNFRSGQYQRDNILSHNFENYSFFNQPYEKVSPLGKIGISYTTKSSEWTFDISFRAKKYSGDYVLGNNVPFEYYPGSIQYNWSEGQYSVIRSHALTNFFMIQPQIGIREIREDYNRTSNILSYPLGKSHSTVREQSQTFSQQAGLTFHFKLLENLRFKFTGKIFQGLSGNQKYTRNEMGYNELNYYFRAINSKANNVTMDGNEIEGEISYSLKRFNFFIGYSLTTFYKEANRDPNFIPVIMTNQNLHVEYMKYFLTEALSDKNSFSSGDPRLQTLKNLYFGVSVNF